MKQNKKDSSAKWKIIGKFFKSDNESRNLILNSFEIHPNLSFFDQLFESKLCNYLDILSEDINKETIIPNNIETQKEEKKAELAKKISAEKFKRNQAYVALDYVLSLTTYYDYFDVDTLMLIKEAKNLGKFAKEIPVNSETLLLAFLGKERESHKILKEYNLTLNKALSVFDSKKFKKNIFQLAYNFFKKKKEWVEDKLINRFNLILNWFQKGKDEEEKILFELREVEIEDISVGKDFTNLLAEAVKLGIKYQTPVITPDILFLALLDDKSSLTGKIIKRVIRSARVRSLLRYRIVKKIYNEKILFNSLVPINQRFFGYLFKSELSEVQFKRLVENKEFSKAVRLYRNTLIKSILSINLTELIDEDIIETLAISQKRKYWYKHSN